MFKNINPVVKMMVVADFFFNGAFGSFAPAFAIFITGQIAGGSAQVAGFAAAVYWLTKSILQLPIARFLDKTDGEKDDFWALFFGYFFSSFVPVAYIFATEPWHLYAIQVFFGICMSWAVPAWYSIFTRHVDKWRISFEWSLQSVFAVGIATSIATALGGYVADTYGFTALFVGAGVASFLASFLVLSMRGNIYSQVSKNELTTPEKAEHAQ